MQKRNIFFLVLLICLNACRNTPAKDAAQAAAPGQQVAKDTMNIFPVSDFLAGQIKTIESMPVTPLRLITDSDKTDSAWITREDIQKFARPFFNPVIDSAMLSRFFKGNSFLDQTVNSVTLTYSIIPEFTNRLPLRTITVYIHPETNKVERVYIEKEAGDTIEQLTWKPDDWFSIRKIEDGKINEEKIKWNFAD